MRFLLLVLLLVGCTKATNADRTFDGVFEVPSTPKDQIYNSTKIWIAETFRSAKAVIEYDNKEEGTLIGNGVTSYTHGMLSGMKVSFTMRADIKDNKFKLTFSNINDLRYKEDLDNIKVKLLSLGNELVTAIQKNSNKKDF